MGFWQNIDEELKYRGISRKELAISISMKEPSLHKAIERDSEVSSITAMKIAQFLNIPLESLLEIQTSNTKNTTYSTEALQIAHDYTNLTNRDKKIIKAILQEMKKK